MPRVYFRQIFCEFEILPFQSTGVRCSSSSSRNARISWCNESTVGEVSGWWHQSRRQLWQTRRPPIMRDRRHLTHASNYQRAAASHKLRPSYVLSGVFLSNYARRFVLLVSPVCHSSVSCRLERFIIISWPSYWSVLSWLCKPPPGAAVHQF